jgi:hypothetical protein
LLLHEKTTMLRPMKRCKQRTNLWLGHSIWRIRFWFAWKATIVFRPQDRQKKAAGHIHLPGSFVVRAAREDRNVEVKGKVNENFSRVSPILRLRPFLRNFLTTSIPQLVFHVSKICSCYLFFLVSCQGFCARLCSRCVPSTIWYLAVLFLWCCEGFFFGVLGVVEGKSWRCHGGGGLSRDPYQGVCEGQCASCESMPQAWPQRYVPLNRSPAVDTMSLVISHTFYFCTSLQSVI